MATTTLQKPTAAQRRVLANLIAGREPAAHIVGRSAHGGFFATWQSLRRRGWVDGAAITDAGRQAMAA